MRLDVVMLADHAAACDGKLYVNGGGITSFQVPTVPFALPGLGVVLRFRTYPEDMGEHQFQIEFINPDGLQVLPPDPVRVLIESPGDGLDAEESFSQLVLAFAGLPILTTGMHTFRISWDDELLREFCIPVRLDADPGSQSPS